MSKKERLYTSVQRVVPPIVFEAFRKSPLYDMAKSVADRHYGSIKPGWHVVNNGVLKKRWFYFNGGVSWHKEMLDGSYDAFFFDYLKKRDLSGKTILDIGAHVGYSALCFAELVGVKGRVLTFEPNPYNTRYIKETLAKNPELAQRIQLFEIALSSSNGHEDFIFSDKVEEGMSSGSFIESADTISEKSDYEARRGFKRTTVETARLDSLLESKMISGSVDIMKIDVEGAESLVLEGATETIRRHAPLLLIEVHSISNMYSVMQFLNNESYSSELLKKEPDGRCFIAAAKKHLSTKR